LKRLFIPLITVAALGLAVVGVGAGLAQQGNGTATTFLAKVAAKLGIGEDKLTTAVDEAYNETLDEAVTAGRLTQEQADTLKERGFDFAPQFGPGFGERGPHGGVQVMDAAATVLGMSVDDLMTELKDGKSLVDVAAAKGISQEKLTADLLAQVKTQLDSLVSEGKLTQEQADNSYAQTESNIDQIVSDTSGLNFGPGFGDRGPHGGVRVMDAAGTVLGMNVSDLMTELKDGKSLADVATAKGISQEKLTADLLAQVKTQLDGLVSDGKLTQEQADNIYTQTESNIDQIVSGQSGFFGGGRPHGAPGLGPMSGPSENPTPGGMVQPETGL
jgi:polyhydroxyalkanoate synthesis regulator phasin